MDSNEVGLGAMASVLSCVELRLRNTVDAFEVLIVVDLSRWEILLVRSNYKEFIGPKTSKLTYAVCRTVCPTVHFPFNHF